MPGPWIPLCSASRRFRMNQPPRQTVSYLTRRFREVGLEPDHRLGQNFLIDINLLELLARAAAIDEHDVVLEVGTGTGSLTGIMATKAAEVVTVELDGHLHQLARETLEGRRNITFLKADILKNKNRLNPEVMQTIREKLAAAPGRRFKLAANLPYNVATPIISNLLAGEPVPHSMTVTIQKELAERIVAAPSTKDYGSLSVWIQSQCRPEIVRILNNKVFWPRPKVESAIIRIEFDPEKRARIPDLPYFHTFVRSLFFHRRKFLRSVLIAAFKDRLTKSEADEVMSRFSLGADARAEQLTIEQILPLCEAFRERTAEKEASD